VWKTCALKTTAAGQSWETRAKDGVNATQTKAPMVMALHTFFGAVNAGREVKPPNEFADRCCKTIFFFEQR
jgi:hypothetical protein